MGKFIDLTGQRFGRLTVIKRDGVTKNKHTIWLCQCSCGNIIKTTTQNLRKGATKSCGCYHIERAVEANTKHSKTNTRIYKVYRNMKNRCYNIKCKHYKDYGGRGIKICDEWLNKENGFMNFYNWAIKSGYDETAKFHQCTIDRIDVNGNYEPNNCRWATNKEQCNNKRNNHYITYNGETHTITEWSEILNIPFSILSGRINKNLDINKVFNKPIGNNRCILQYDINGNFIKKYKSITKAQKEIGVSSISYCCRGKTKTAAGYVWKYENDFYKEDK